MRFLARALGSNRLSSQAYSADMVAGIFTAVIMGGGSTFSVMEKRPYGCGDCFGGGASLHHENHSSTRNDSNNNISTVIIITIISVIILTMLKP